MRPCDLVPMAARTHALQAWKLSCDVHASLLVYAASIHLAWAATRTPNHELTSPNSTCVLQCTREDLKLIPPMEIDADAHEIITLVFDGMTDKGHFHLVTRAVTQATDGHDENHDEASKYSKAAAMHGE